MDDRVKLLIERIEQFPEEFEKIEGNFTHLKWLLWFKTHFEHLTGEEKSAVSAALSKVLRESALCGIVETIADKNTRIDTLGSVDPKHLVVNPAVAKRLNDFERKMFKGSAVL